MERPLFPVAVIQALLTAGVREFVLCAGARNSAFVVVLAAADGKARLWQHFEERAAGFFALGRARATGRPVAVVTTSGTAAAELLPAMIEAHYQGLPLVALTADRPFSYRGSGAPQAIEQAGLFSRYPSLFVDVEEERDGGCPSFSLANWDGRGPLHVNAGLSEPDSASLPGLREAATSLELPGESSEPALSSAVEISAPLPPQHLLLAGELMDGEIEKSAAFALGGFLVDAEAASGLREVPALRDHLLRCGDATLRHLPVTHAVRLGGTPACRYWRDLEDRPDIGVILYPSRGGHPGLARKEGIHQFPCPLPPGLDLTEYQARDARLAGLLEGLLETLPASEPGLIRLLSSAIPRGATVFTGNSLAVREWNLCAVWGRGHRVHVLRGANGIDGNLSAFLGLAADQPEAWCVTGDLTTLYDLSAPWMLRQLPPGRRRFVVIQNAGGKIFSRLPSLRGLTPRERAFMENPHRTPLKPWAEMWGMDHLAGGPEILQNPAALEALGDHAVIELYPDEGETGGFWQRWHAAGEEVWA